jgi:class 3 adenylate cyclase
VAVAVLRDGMRPDIPDDAQDDYMRLMTNCWDQDPQLRPTFLEIMTRLESMIGESTTSSSTYSSRSSFTEIAMPESVLTSLDDGETSKAHAGAPDGEVVIVITDIAKAASLWEFNAEAMKDATLLHNETIRAQIRKHGGYEAALIRNGSTGEGSFCVAFADAASALEWCMDVQKELLKVDWPEAILAHPAAAEENGEVDDRVLYKGLRVRMGVTVGRPKMAKDPVSRRIEYIGPVVNTAARITALTHGGQVLISQELKKQLKDHSITKEKDRILFYGRIELPHKNTGTNHLYG